MEHSISDHIRDEFDRVLRHCALKGAISVTYVTETTTSGATSSLKYYDSSKSPIGDNRDYDVLKSCFAQLERLSERLIEDGHQNSNIKINKLEIDLDLISGHMSVSAQ